MSASAEELISDFIANAVYRIDENTRKLEYCLRDLSEEEVWRKPNDCSNSVANLVLHLCGNIRQYIMASIGGHPDNRKRDEEFTISSGLTKNQLLQQLLATLEEAKQLLKEVTVAEISRKRNVQTYTLSGMAVVLHVVEHYSYHTGQIIFWTKELKNKDLGFYNDAQLNESSRDL